MGKIYHASTNYKKTGVATVISGIVDIRTRNKKEHFIMMRVNVSRRYNNIKCVFT